MKFIPSPAPVQDLVLVFVVVQDLVFVLVQVIDPPHGPPHVARMGAKDPLKGEDHANQTQSLSKI